MCVYHSFVVLYHNCFVFSRPSHNVDDTGSSVVGKPHALAASMSVRPSFSSRQPTQPPRHSIRPMSTDSFSLSNSLLGKEIFQLNSYQTDGAGSYFFLLFQYVLFWCYGVFDWLKCKTTVHWFSIVVLLQIYL